MAENYDNFNEDEVVKHCTPVWSETCYYNRQVGWIPKRAKTAEDIRTMNTIIIHNIDIKELDTVFTNCFNRLLDHLDEFPKYLAHRNTFSRRYQVES